MGVSGIVVVMILANDAYLGYLVCTLEALSLTKTQQSGQISELSRIWRLRCPFVRGEGSP